MELRDLLLMFEWLSARDGCTIQEVMDRFGLDRSEIESIVSTLSMVGFQPESPDVLLDAYIDEEDDTIHVAPFRGLDQGVSIEIETALRLISLADAVLTLGKTVPEQTDRALTRLREALNASGVQAKSVATDLSLPGSEHVAPIGSAISQNTRLRLKYRSASGDVSEREVDPIAVFLDGSWYLEAFDHMRQDRRHFKLERIIEVENTQEPASTQHLPVGALEVDAGTTKIVLEVEPQAGWLLEHLDNANVMPVSRGISKVEVHGGGYEWIVPLILTAGAHARVVSPPELVTRVADEIERALAQYR
jgi:proteasome accessory factor C